MKSKFAKIWGVALAVTLLASLIVFTLPASAGTLAFTPVESPNTRSNIVSAAVDNSVFAMAPDGKTMFIYDNVNKKLFRSTNSGASFSSTNLGIGLGFNDGVRAAIGAADSTVVAMSVSPNYATDNTLVAAISATVGGGDENEVYRSINGGSSWGRIGNTGIATAADLAITSVDISPYYMGGDGIVIGYADVIVGADAVLAGIGGAKLFTTTGLAWTAIDPLAPAGGNLQVLDIKFSPNHQGDAEIVALTSDGTTSYLQAKFGTEAWGATVVASTIAPGLKPLYGTMDFPLDYEWSGNNKIFIGTAFDTAGADEDDVYLVSGALAGGSSRITDLNLNGVSTPTDVRSVAAKGNFVGAKLLASAWAQTTVYRATDPSASTVTWYTATKDPSGGSVAAVLASSYMTLAWNPTTDDSYAASSISWTTTALRGAAFSVSRDSGLTYNGLSMIEISAINQMYITDIEAVDASTMFIIAYDDNNNSGSPLAGAATDAGDLTMLFKTANGGANWEMVKSVRATGTEKLQFIGVSPAYATDSTVYVAENTTRIWKSTSGGTSFIGLTNPGPITAFYAVDGSTYYTGATGTAPQPAIGFYKSGRWTSPTLTAQVRSIAIGKDNVIFIGNANGGVLKSMDDGKAFVPAGNTVESGYNIYVAVDPDGTTLYAGSQGAASTGGGLWGFYSGATVWTKIDSGVTTSSTTTTTFGADSFSVTFPAGSAAGNDFELTETSGKVLVTRITGLPTVAYNAVTGKWLVTAAAALDSVLVTATGTTQPCSGTLQDLAPANAVALTCAAVTDGNANAIVPATIPTGAPGVAQSFILPDLSGSTTATTTAGALKVTETVSAPDGTLYVANSSAAAGLRRSVNPKGPTDVARKFQSVTQDLTGDLNNASFYGLELVTPNKLYGVASVPTAVTFYGTTRIAAFDDTIAVSPSLSAPRDGSVIGGTSATLSWTKLDSPMSLTYEVDTSTDADMANSGPGDGSTTIGSTISFTGYTPGTTYWWRIRVQKVGSNDLASKWSAKWTFTPELGVLSESGQVAGPTLQSPAYGSDDILQRPTFSWLAVAGAESYELQLSTNPFFAMATNKGPLSHTTWTWDEDLTYGTTYYWRVRAVKSGSTFSPWSEGVFTIMAEPKPVAPPVQVNIPAVPPAPVINLPQPQVTVQLPPAAPPAPSPVNATVIWAIIIIGAILVVAVIVLIVRTRRVP